MKEEKFRMKKTIFVKLFIFAIMSYIFLSFEIFLYNIQKKLKINKPAEAR